MYLLQPHFVIVITMPINWLILSEMVRATVTTANIINQDVFVAILRMQVNSNMIYTACLTFLYYSTLFIKNQKNIKGFVKKY